MTTPIETLLYSVVAVGALCGASGAAVWGREEPEARHATVSLVCETKAVKPGAAARLGLVFAIQDGWHIYWNGFTTTGVPPTVKWTVPEGVTAEPLQWPAPTRHALPGDILDHIYERRVLLPVMVTIPESAKPGERISIRGKVEYLVCEDVCIGEKAEVELTIAVADGAAVDPANAKDFAATDARLPKPMPADGSVRVEWMKNAASVQAKGASGLTFFPSGECADLVDVTKDATSESDRLTLRLDPEALESAPIEGVLEVRAAGAPTRFFTIRAARPPQPIAKPSAAAAPAGDGQGKRDGPTVRPQH